MRDLVEIDDDIRRNARASSSAPRSPARASARRRGASPSSSSGVKSKSQTPEPASALARGAATRDASYDGPWSPLPCATLRDARAALEAASRELSALEAVELARASASGALRASRGKTVDASERVDARAATRGAAAGR